MELASAGGSGDATGAADDLKSPHVAGGEAAVPGRYVADLIAAIHDSADKLARGHTSRGDLKILSRTLRELRYAFKVFAPYRRKRKVAVFGSARTKAGDACFKQALEFGRQMAECGWLVVTGAGGGIMEAGHQGAGRENSMGLNILLPFEQAANAVVAGDPKLVHMKYFFTRKLVFVKKATPSACSPEVSGPWTKVSKCSRSSRPANATWCRSFSSTNPVGLTGGLSWISSAGTCSAAA